MRPQPRVTNKRRMQLQRKVRPRDHAMDRQHMRTRPRARRLALNPARHRSSGPDQFEIGRAGSARYRQRPSPPTTPRLPRRETGLHSPGSGRDREPGTSTKGAWATRAGLDTPYGTALPAAAVLAHAAVELSELRCLDAGNRLFEGARRLDPSLARLHQNVAAVHSHRRARGPQTVQPALAGLARGAVLVAAEARPATGLTLSLCMIVRDEERSPRDRARMDVRIWVAVSY